LRWRDLLVQMAILIATLAICEVVLRVADLRELRDNYNAGANFFQYDAEIGWSPLPNAAGKFVGSREIDVRQNSLGLRDIEHGASPRPTVLFVGDSFTWGYDAQANERFTELLRNDLPGHSIVNAGVSGYGTDQEYLLLRRIWSAINPAVVVLIFCVENDRVNNRMNIQYAGYFKPYLQRDADGTWRFRGQPVPWSRSVYFREYWWVRNLWLARLAATAYVYFFRHFEITVADPTEQLIDMMRDFVEARGAKLLVGLQRSEPQLESFLQAKRIPFVAFDGAESYELDGSHWTPAGHRLVADRLLSLFSATGVAASTRATSGQAPGRAD
jgi:lysophospholipase L1-like esterase